MYGRRVAIACFGLICGAVIIEGCSFNPFSPPDFSESPFGGKGGQGATASSGGGTGGIAGQGGAGGQGGSSGQGGTGGAPCMCEDDNNECTTDLPSSMECPDGDETKCHTIRPDQSCSAGWCNDKGECKDCKTCITAGTCDTERCDGIACSDDPQCKNGHCEQGICCNEACDVGPCKACNRPGVEGKCTRMPLGLKCGDNLACNVDGGCAATQIAPLGASCGMADQCTSNVCRGEYCRSAVGEPCIEDIECNGNYCDPTTKTCQSCTDPGAMCPGGGECLPIVELCQVLPGQPTTIPEECIPPAIISAFMCKLKEGEKCSRHGECESNYCKSDPSGTKECGPKCVTDANCPSGTKCEPVNKVCTMQPGEYCVEPKFCASGKCGGFPPKCQP